MLIPMVLAVAVMAAPQQQRSTQRSNQTDTTVSVRAGARLSVENFGGSVTVRVWDRSQVRVRATHGRRERIDIQSSSTGLRIEAESQLGVAHSVDYDITVPTSMHIAVEGTYTSADIEGVQGEVEVETVQGDIRVVGGSGRIRLESVQGQIQLSRSKGRIDVSTVNRGIHVADVSGDIIAETVNGPIILERVQATTVDAATVNGTIVYDGTIRSGGDYAMATHNGNIWLVVPNSADATIMISTFNGKLDASFPVTVDSANKRRFSFTLGNGSAQIDLETFGGDVRLRRPGESHPTYQPGTDKSKNKEH